MRHLHEGPAHDAAWREYLGATARCDAEGLWRDVSTLGDHVYTYQSSTAARNVCVSSKDKHTEGMHYRPAGGHSVDEQTDPTIAANVTKCWSALRSRQSVGSPEFRCALRRHANFLREDNHAQAATPQPTLRRCELRSESSSDEDVGGDGFVTWTITRGGPYIGHGGYDWHGLRWLDVGGFSSARPADVDAWFIGAVNPSGGPLSYPPLHLHHAHVRASGCIPYDKDINHVAGATTRIAHYTQGPDAPFRARPSDSASSSQHSSASDGGALVFESHADESCVAKGSALNSSDSGARCFLRVLPAGSSMRIAEPLRLDAHLNDVRPVDGERSTPPLTIFADVAFRWRSPRRPPARPRRRAAMLTLGNPCPSVAEPLTGGLNFCVGHSRRDVPSVFHFDTVLPIAMFTDGGDRWRDQRYPDRDIAPGSNRIYSGRKVRLIDLSIHSHQRLFRSALFFRAPLHLLGLPPLPLPYESAPLSTQKEAQTLLQRLLTEPSLVCHALAAGLEHVARVGFEPLSPPTCTPRWESVFTQHAIDAVGVLQPG